MNKIFLIGNLTADPEINYTKKEDIPVCNFTIAVNNYQTERTDFFKVTAWRGLGENVEKYCKKGSKVAVVGECQIEKYEDKDGNTRTDIRVVAEAVEFLSYKDKDEDEDEDEDDRKKRKTHTNNKKRR